MTKTKTATSWLENASEGPKCHCGQTTVIKIFDGDVRPNIFCFAHTSLEAAIWPLPAEKPEDFDGWDNATDEQISRWVDIGSKEEENED